MNEQSEGAIERKRKAAVGLCSLVVDHMWPEGVTLAQFLEGVPPEMRQHFEYMVEVVSIEGEWLNEQGAANTYATSTLDVLELVTQSVKGVMKEVYGSVQ